MLYALICTDKPSSLPLRKANRPEHLAYLQSLGATVLFAGPFTDADGAMNGSLVVIEAASLEEARKQGAVLAWGRFITLTINFLIVAAVLFIVIRLVNTFMKKEAEKAPALTKSEELLTEIRDALKQRG